VFYDLLQRGAGVLRGLDNALVLSTGGALEVVVGTGRASKSGYLYANDAALTLALDPVTSGSQRIDRIVARVDLIGRMMSCVIIKGAESGSPVAPSTTGATDVLLGKILLNRTSGSYVYTVTDERTYTRVWTEDNDGPSSGLDADTVSGYGIGNNGALLTTFASASIPNGKYYGSLITGGPAGPNACVIEVLNHVGASDEYKVRDVVSALMYEGQRTHGATSAITWYQIFSARTDGNGGQPPAPRPAISPSGGADTQGQAGSITYSGVTADLFPAGVSKASGIWVYLWIGRVTASGAMTGAQGGMYAGIVAGNTRIIVSMLAANTYDGFFWRVS
jgi:hypothetical protein